jgi:DNA-binding NarL/FixJ family response regulator
MMNVLLYDEPGLIVEGVRSTLNKTGRYELVTNCSKKCKAIQCYQRHKPKVVLLEILINDRCWLQVIEEIKLIDPLAKILVFTFISDKLMLDRVIDIGAQGYVLKRNHSDLINAIDKLMSGRLYIDQTYNKEKTAIDDKIEILSNLPKRELEVLISIAKGNLIKVIAKKMGVTEKTIYNTRSRLKKRLGVKSQRELSELAETWALKIFS